MSSDQILNIFKKRVPGRLAAAAGGGLALSLLWLIVVVAGQPSPAEVLVAPVPEVNTRAWTLERQVKELTWDRETLDLAVEFGFDPVIVTVVRRLSAEVIENAREEIRDGSPVWRLVDSEWELSYLMLGIIKVESGGNVYARGDSGDAYGLTQMHLATARDYRPSVTGPQLLSIQDHLDVAMRHFVDLLYKYQGNYTLAVLAWNRGGGTVNRVLELGESPANGYARKVFMSSLNRNARLNDMPITRPLLVRRQDVDASIERLP